MKKDGKFVKVGEITLRLEDILCVNFLTYGYSDVPGIITFKNGTEIRVDIDTYNLLVEALTKNTAKQ